MKSPAERGAELLVEETAQKFAFLANKYVNTKIYSSVGQFINDVEEAIANYHAALAHLESVREKE